MEQLASVLRGLVVYGTLLLILQFCANGVLEIFGHPEITFVQTLCGFVLFFLTVFFTSYFWHRGKTRET